MSDEPHAPAAVSPKKSSGTHCIRGWVKTGTSLDVVEKRPISGPCRNSKPASSIP